MDEEELMVRPMSWETFQATGLLWWINRILHTFGWAIVLEAEEDGTIMKAYPARVRYRGFDRATEETGFIKVSGYMASQGDNLAREIDDEEDNDP